MTTRCNISPVWKHFSRGIIERSGGRTINSLCEGVFNGEVKGKVACATCGKLFENRAAIEQVTCDATDCGQTLPDTKVVVCKECGGLYAGPNVHSAANCLKHLKHRHQRLYDQVLREREEADLRIIRQSMAALGDNSLSPNQRQTLMKKYLSALQRRLADNEGSPEELRKACQGIEPAALRDEIHLEWHVVVCNVTNEAHMWNFVRVSSDATQLKRHATTNGPEKIVGPDRRLVNYVTKRIGEYKTMLEEKGRSQPWFNKLYTELHLDAHDSMDSVHTAHCPFSTTGSLDWLELYVRQSAALTFLGYVANGEMRNSLVFYHTWCVGIVCYE